MEPAAGVRGGWVVGWVGVPGRAVTFVVYIRVRVRAVHKINANV